MPTIKKLPKKEHKTAERKETDMRIMRQKAYQNPQWRKMRESYMHEHPICEECLKQGKITPAHDIHHKKSPFRSGEVNWTLLLDYNNLEAVCKDCHGRIHAKQQGHLTPEEIIKQLDALFDQDNITDKDIEDGNYE